ncbi:MAG: nitrogenase component 1 [Dehalococcoidia bacterium]
MGTSERCHDPYLRCALYGAAQVALGVSGCCVLSHAPQGCQTLVNSAFNWQDADYTETKTLCTKLCEDEIVHGGEELLARTILEAKELDAPILFVLSACGPEIVGDDINAVCEDIRPQVEYDLVPIECAGFRGSQYDGTDLALDVLLRCLVPPCNEKTPNSVCLLAPHANANPTWMGDLLWVKSILERMGLPVVATMTHRTPLSEFVEVARAETSLVLSHDAGEKAARYLEEEHGVEPICVDIPLPIGFTNTARWLRRLGERFDATETAERIISEGEAEVVERCRRKWVETQYLHRVEAAIVADATVGIPLLHFVAEDLEMVPSFIALRSAQPRAQAILEKELRELKLEPTVVWGADVHAARLGLDKTRPQAVFGSNIERHAIEELDIPFIFQLVNPIHRFRMLDREYFGYGGVLNLLESILNDYRDRYRSKFKRYKARW